MARVKMKDKSKSSFCPCCGYRTLDEPGGHYEVCPVCFWEDDPIQAIEPTDAGGANRVTLAEAQTNFENFGACERRFLKQVRKPRADEDRKPE